MNLSATVRNRSLLWGVLIFGALLRVYRLDFQSLWADEGLQYFIANAESIQGVLGRLFRTFHPPLSFLIHHLFLQFGDSDWFLRLPSALFGIGSIPLLYLLARRLTPQPGPIFTALVLAISPFHVWYSQEARMYAQMLFLSLLSMHCLLLALERQTLLWWGAYTLAVVVGLYTHIFMALGVIAQYLWMFLYHRRSWRMYGLCGLVIAGCCLPLLLPWGKLFFSSVESTLEHKEVSFSKRGGFTWMALPYTFFVWSVGLSLGPSVAVLHEERTVNFLLPFLPTIMLVGVLFGVLLIVGLVTFPRRPNTASLALCLLGLSIPVMGVAGLSMLTRFVFNVRYAIVAFPYFCLFVGAALAFLWKKNRWLGGGAWIIVLGLSFVSLAHHFFDPYYAKEDIRATVALWRTHTTNEPLLVSASAGGVKDVVRRYLAAPEMYRLFLTERRSLVESVHSILATSPATSAYIIFVRDWHREREKPLLESFKVEPVHSSPGIRMYRIFRP